MKLCILDEVCEFQSGLWTGKKGPFKVVKVLRNTNFTKDNKLNLENIAEIKVEVKQFEKRVLEKGDILIEKSGGGPNQPVGRVVLIDKRAVDYSFSNFTSRIRVSSNNLNPNYLYWFLNYIYLSGKTENLQRRSTGIRNLQLKEYKQLVIPVPSLQEQEKIVERLYKVFENINIDLSTTKKMIKYNDSLKQSRIDYLFKSISDKSDKFKLSELGELITGNTPNTQEKDNYGNAIPFIKPGDFNQDGSLNYNNQGLSKKGKLKARLVNKNSVLMVCIGATIGKVGITSKEITTNQQINSIVPSNKIDSYFLYYQMLTTKFQKLVLDSSSQATLPIINKKKWGQIIVDVPTKTIQKESAKALDHFIFLNNELNLKFKLKIKLLKELKKSILIKEFSNE